ISPDILRQEFFTHERLVANLYSAVKPDPIVVQFAEHVLCLSALADAIKAKLNPDHPDISGVMSDINVLLDGSIAGMTISEAGPPSLDLSKIDFEALRKRFEKYRHKNTDLEVLKVAIKAHLEKLVRLNSTRVNFAERFAALIDSYNAGSRSIEELFEELVKLSRALDEEQERHVRESMTEEELAIFDILTRPAPELSPEERAEVKKVARSLLGRLKQLLVLNWRQKTAARSRLRLAIEEELDNGLPRVYTKETYQQKCVAIFEHVYERYPEYDASVYAQVG
ncbi:MAG: type I restriction enzyme endonuclease domain-containing protein, partial [Rectinema sp.]